MRLVIVESPYAGFVDRNLRYARDAMQNCLLRGEAPFASHALYTQDGVLDDDEPDQRDLGVECGLAWGRHADATVAYIDHGITPGMAAGIARAEREGRPVEFRRIVGER